LSSGLADGVRAPRAWDQLHALLRLRRTYLRRQPLRVGEAPNLTGSRRLPLLLSLITVWLAIHAWNHAHDDVSRAPALFAWHIAGVLCGGFALGLCLGAGRLRLRNARDDGFLDGLPLTTFARLGLQLTDSSIALPAALAVPLGAYCALGPLTVEAVPGVLLGGLGYLSCFVAGRAAIAWARVLGPPRIGRWGMGLGVVLGYLGAAAAMLPLRIFIRQRAAPRAPWLSEVWIGSQPNLALLYAGTVALGGLAFGALKAAERVGYDQLDPQVRTPRHAARTSDRDAIERAMMLRQGGVVWLAMLGLLVLGTGGLLVTGPQLLSASLLQGIERIVFALAVLQISALAMRGAQRDMLARPFLATLSMSPYAVLDGKVRALRGLTLPILWLFALLAGVSAARFGLGSAYRAALALGALYLACESTVSVSFLSSRLGRGPVHASFDVSTQLLTLPIFMTLWAPDAWIATSAFVAVAAIAWESRRAASLRVRWLDDAAPDIERETTVWRALLAVGAAHAAQGFATTTLKLFQPDPRTLATLVIILSSLVIALVMRRNEARIQWPPLRPNRSWYWPLALLAALVTAWIARVIMVALADFSGATSAASGPRDVQWAALLLVATFAAPPVEEYLFRGWLQPAIAADLPGDKKRYAFVITAIAFALFHLGTFGVPQLLLGSVAGALVAFGGGLGPAILCHAVYNAIVML
jgi:membrane protease YdiL (CAAX protease family)